jgi:hypothetical protein
VARSVAGGGSAGELDDIIIRGNRLTGGAGTPYLADAQGIFLSGNSDINLDGLIVEGNIIDQRMVNGILAGSVVGGSIRYNTIVKRLGNDNFAGTTRISIAGDAATLVQFNVSTAFDVTGGAINNGNTTLAYTSVAYEAAFDNPPTGIEATTAAVDYNPKTSGTLAVLSPVPGALPHQSYVSPWTFTAPTFAPTLTSPVDTADGTDAMTGSVSTNVESGTLYWSISTSATPPTAAQVKLGQTHTGAAASASGSQSVTVPGSQAISDSGLTPATTYYTHYMHESSSGQSSVSSADGFTTAVLSDYVGGKVAEFYAAQINNQSISLTDLTGGTDSAPQEGDIVVIAHALSSNTDRRGTMAVTTSGYTSVGSVFANSTNDANFEVWYKVMGASPDTTVAVDIGTTTADPKAVLVQVYRNKNTTTPLDGITPLTATNTGSADPNPPGPITPATSGAWIIVAAMTTTGDGATGENAPITASYLQNPVSTTGFVPAQIRGLSAIMGHVVWTSGGYDPAAMSTTATDAGNSWAAATFVLKPA